MRFSLIFLALVAVTAEPSTVRPVSKVIKLLEDMQKQLQKDADTDQAIFTKMKCWCETNGKDKTLAIATASKSSTALAAKIDELTGKSAQLAADLTRLKQEVQDNRNALNKAADIRDDELSKFNEANKELTQTIMSLKSAITVLGKHHPSDAALAQITTVVKAAAFKHSKELGPIANTIQTLLQQPQGASYSSRSGEIFGVLKQMQEQFEDNLSDEQKEEMDKAAAFAGLKAAKQKEIAAGKQQIMDKTGEKAATDKANADAQAELEDTDAALAADRAFLADLESKCGRTDREMEQRTKARNDELSAVAETIRILNDDEAHEGFSKSVNTGKMVGRAEAFIQVSASRTSAVRVLSAAAEKFNEPKLAMLAENAKLDAFTKVKAAIDKMIADLDAQMKDEVKHRDFCRTEFAETDTSTSVTSDERSALESKIAELEARIKTLTEEINVHNADVTETNKQVKRAGDDRAAANAEFMTTVNDQRATQAVLQRASDRMKVFYDPDVIIPGSRAEQEAKDAAAAQSAFVQDPTPGAEAPPPPSGFAKLNKNQGGNRVLNMLQKIMDESKVLEVEATKDEQDQVSAYTSFVRDSNKALNNLTKSIATKTDQKANAEEALVNANKDHKNSMDELARLADYTANLHKSCDFVINNFDSRQEARAQEMEALRQAKGILSGSMEG